MKLIGTRIRVEKSVNKTEYFPEYCLEEKTWWGLGKTKQSWCKVKSNSSHLFDYAVRAVDDCIPRTEDWAKAIIDAQAHYWSEHLKKQDHEQTKEITYVKYP